MHFSELDTPALAVDLDVLENNINTLQTACDSREIGLRVHTKTHKTPEIARMQIEAGAIGICSQKLGEAEAMAEGGIGDILIPYNIVGRPKLERLTRLVKREITTLTVAADSKTTVVGISDQAARDECTVRVIVEMDTGSHRCGVQSPQETLELAQLIDRLHGLEFAGVMTYHSGDTVKPFLDKVRDLTAKAGLDLDIISAGGTGSQVFCKELGCTEARIGSYAWEGMTRIGKREDLNPQRWPAAHGDHRDQHSRAGAAHHRRRHESLYQLPADPPRLLPRAPGNLHEENVRRARPRRYQRIVTQLPGG